MAASESGHTATQRPTFRRPERIG